MAAESSYYSIDADELNECGDESECPLDDSNVLDSHRFADLPRFVQLVEDNLGIISDPERFEDGWRKIFAGGKEAGCDWADEDWTSGENLWKQLQFKANNFRKNNGTSKRVGMSRDKYENIVRFLTHNEYPQEIRGDGTLRSNFKKKCETYFLHSNGLLGHRKKKYVLLEGELEDVFQDIHLKLGHAQYSTVRKVVESNFAANSMLASVVKQLSGECNVREWTCTSLEVDHVSLHVERLFGRISLKLYFKGSLCEKSTKECCQVSTETGNVGMVGLDEKYKQLTAFLRYGNEPAEYSQRLKLRNWAKDYKWTEHGLMRKSKLGELLLILRESEVAGVIQHLHEIYGHPCAQKMKTLFDQRFYYSGFSTFCPVVLDLCRLCSLRKYCHHRDVTPSKLYENAKYDVDVKWEGEKRIISIYPVGLDTKEVEKYVSMIEKKYGARNKDKLPAEVDDLNAALFEKVLSIADFTNKGDHSFTQTQATKKTSVCEQLMHDKTIPDVGTPSMAGNCERFSGNTSGRKSIKRKASSAIHHSPSTFSNGKVLHLEQWLTDASQRKNVVNDSDSVHRPFKRKVHSMEDQPCSASPNLAEVLAEQCSQTPVTRATPAQENSENALVHSAQAADVSGWSVAAEDSASNSSSCQIVDLPIDYKPPVVKVEKNPDNEPGVVFQPLEDIADSAPVDEEIPKVDEPIGSTEDEDFYFIQEQRAERERLHWRAKGLSAKIERVAKKNALLRNGIASRENEVASMKSELTEGEEEHASLESEHNEVNAKLDQLLISIE